MCDNDHATLPLFPLGKKKLNPYPKTEFITTIWTRYNN